MKVYRSVNAGKRVIDTYDKLLAMWDVDTEEMDIPTAYGVTHVIHCGDMGNPPLLLFHGVGDDAALMWIYNAKALAQHFNVLAVDTLGGPGKSRPNERYIKGFDDAVWIDEVLDELGLGCVNVAGVSNGAYLTQYYGLHRPERVLKMICMAGTVPVGDKGPMGMMMRIFLPEALLPTKGNVVKLLRKLSGSNYKVFTENPVLLEHYGHLLRGFNNMSMRFHMITSFTDEQIDVIRDKTLYLMGDADPFARLGGKEMLLKYGMNARFFPDVGHGINHEIADIINGIMVDYLKAPS